MNAQKKIIFIVLSLCLLAPTAHAKKKDKPIDNAPVTTASRNSASYRVAHLSSDDQRQFDSLSQEQKDKISHGEIDKGFNEWMVKLALGDPFYATEHHPVFVDYEQVWLYTKPDVNHEVSEEKIIDRQTNWPTVHRKTRTKTCMITDYFVLWDRGVVDSISPAKDKKVQGSCTIETEEAFLPIVDGKPVEAPKAK